jgi:hypothetical protein
MRTTFAGCFTVGLCLWYDALQPCARRTSDPLPLPTHTHTFTWPLRAPPLSLLPFTAGQHCQGAHRRAVGADVPPHAHL